MRSMHREQPRGSLSRSSFCSHMSLNDRNQSHQMVCFREMTLSVGHTSTIRMRTNLEVVMEQNPDIPLIVQHQIRGNHPEECGRHHVG